MPGACPSHAKIAALAHSKQLNGQIGSNFKDIVLHFGTRRQLQMHGWCCRDTELLATIFKVNWMTYMTQSSLARLFEPTD